MVPTLYPGDKIFVNGNYYKHHALADGDLVVFHHNGYIIVKRLSALPGETIEGRDGKLIRNNVLVDEPYVMFSKDNPMPDLETFGSRRMPVGEIFVTGDSRDASLDSRSTEFGPVYLSDVIGRVSLIYFSSHKGQFGRTF
jgi:signal peptidase I